MRRESFDKESKFLGSNLSEIIATFGGKEAGLRVLDRFMSSASQRRKFSDVRIPNRLAIDRTSYDDFESILKTELPTLVAAVTREYRYDTGVISDAQALRLLSFKEHMSPLWDIDSLRVIVDGLLERCAHAFPEELAQSSNQQRFSPASAPNFHVRSSTTVEDFRDDTYYGTFTTRCDHLLFPDRDSSVLSRGRAMIGEVLLSFYIQKHLTPELLLDSGVGLGLVVMPTISSERTRHAIVYSRYPEDILSPVVIEVSQPHYFGGIMRSEPRQVLFVDGTDIAVHQLKSGATSIPSRDGKEKLSL